MSNFETISDPQLATVGGGANRVGRALFEGFIGAGKGATLGMGAGAVVGSLGAGPLGFAPSAAMGGVAGGLIGGVSGFTRSMLGY